jgi:hypothetical protein
MNNKIDNTNIICLHELSESARILRNKLFDDCVEYNSDIGNFDSGAMESAYRMALSNVSKILKIDLDELNEQVDIFVCCDGEVL